MPRIPDEEVARIKQEVSLLALVKRQGYQVTKQGKDYVVKCPFHTDDTPSLVISPKTNLYHCFGCGAAGSVIDWVMKTQNVSFRHAVEILRDDIPSLAAPSQVERKVNDKPKFEGLFSEDDDDQAVLQQVIDFYHETLKQSPDALDYLRKRGLDDPELISQFKIGFANRTLSYRLPSKQYKAGKLQRGKLNELGLLRDSGHEHFNGSIVVPVFDNEGNVVEVYARKTIEKLRKGTPKHLYLPGPHAGVWNHEGLENQSEVILCEALLDAMTFWVHGYKNVTASYGTQGFTDEHLQCFKTCGVERLLIAYDRDEAGNTAAELLAKKLQAEGFGCYRIELPKGMDVNEYALNVTPANKSLGLLIRSALWLGNGQPPKRDNADVADEVNQTADVEKLLDLPSFAAPAHPAPAALAHPGASAARPEINPPAEALPAAPKCEVEAEVKETEITFNFGNRHYRVRGLDKNKNYDVLKVNVLVRHNENLHVDSFDMYSAKARQAFIKLASLEVECEENILKKDLGKVLLKLEDLQEKRLSQTPEPEVKLSALSPEEEQAALELLKDKNLLDRILNDFNRCGVVGEETNKLVGYLAASSRKLDRPLAVIIQSTSAAGKSSLMDAILNLMPEAERVQYSAMTGQSLFYMGETNLKHKILAIAEEEGASNASYALKLLQSEGEITIASTGKNDETGDLITKEYKVEGPVMLFLTTTAIDIDEELLNRCLVLTVNESREQTRAIHAAQRQRRTLEGLQDKLEKEQLVALHRNAQSLLRTFPVINPFASQLTFLDDKTRTRRDHEKYLTLIDSIALLHQHQRQIKTTNHNGKAIEYIEVELSDIEMANKLAHEVLGRTLDELPPQTRKLLKLTQEMVKAGCKSESLEQKHYRFSRRELRAYTHWSDTALKVHMARLVELEYLLVHRSGKGQGYVYELLYDQAIDHAENHMMGLINLKNLGYDEKRSGQNGARSGSGQASVRGQPGQQKPLKANGHNALQESSLENLKSTSLLKNDEHRNLVVVP